MEPRRDFQDITPHRPAPGAGNRPPERRQFISDFAPRPTAPRPAAPQPQVSSPVFAAQQTAPAPAPQPTAQPATQPVQFRPQPVQPITPPQQPTYSQPQAPTPPASPPIGGGPSSTLQPPTPQPVTTETPETSVPKEEKPPKGPHPTAHAGLIGWAVFLLLSALLLAPLLPGKTFANLPLSSQSFSTGDQTLACTKTPDSVSSSTVYDSKAGSPLTYRYATTTTQRATCDGKEQTAVTGHASLFSPLAALANIALAGVLAIIVAKIWKKVRSPKQ